MAPRPSNRSLEHKSDTAQAFSTGLDTPCSVQSLGTTASNPESLGESGVDAWSWARVQWQAASALQGCGPRRNTPRQRHSDELHTEARLTVEVSTLERRAADWTADLEYVWRTRTAPLVEKYTLRARARRRSARDATGGIKVKFLRSAEWAENRARALSMSRADVVNTCGKRWRATACACGPREQLVWCDQPQLCTRCRKWWWGKWRARITNSIDEHVRRARSRWYRSGRRGMLPGVYLLTLTGPHSGDIAVDRERLGDAWRKLTKVAHAGNWWSAYALTWEATSGDDGKGHLHAHIAIVSSWIPYDELHDAWREAMPGAVVLDVRAPKTSNHVRTEAESAARYLAKYVTKGVEASEFSGRKAGELLVAFRGRRKVTTSRHFWHYDARCKKCGCKHRAIGHPVGLQEIAPGAVLRSMSERTRYRDAARFNLQVPLRRADDTPLL